MACSIQLKVVDKFKELNLIKEGNREILNVSEFTTQNENYSQRAKDMYGITRDDLLFDIDVKERTSVRARTVLRAVPNEDFFNTIQEKIDTKKAKVLSFSESGAARIESAHENFYGKLPGFDRSKYNSYLGARENTTVLNEQDKIERLEEAFGAKVIIDKKLDASGALLPSTHPLTKMHNGPVIKINPDKLFADTVYHEFGHLYYSLLGGMSDPLVADAIEMLKGSDLWKTVSDNYPELSGVELAEEVFATALGIEADMVFKKNAEKQSIWQQLKAMFYKALASIFNMSGSESSLERLASEMLTGKPRLSPTREFNNLVEKFSKYKLDNPSQDNIDKLFKALEGDYELDEETHTYTDTEGTVYKKSVSQVAKSLLTGFAQRGRGSFTVNYGPEWNFNKDNIRTILTKSVIPKALDDALNEVYRGEVRDVSVLVPIEEDETWSSVYDKFKHDSIEEQMFEEVIKNHLDIINDLAEEHQDIKDLPLLAGNLIHDALEIYINDRESFPERVVDKTGKLENAIAEIIDTGEANGSKFYTEQMLFSNVANLPGKADLIEITKDGKFKIYDFKTYNSFNRGGKPKNGYQMYTGPGYLNQLLIYGTILEEYNIQPVDENPYNIIALEVDKSDLNAHDHKSPVRITDFKVDALDITRGSMYHKSASVAKQKIVKRFTAPTKLKELGIETKQDKIDGLTKKIKRALDDYNKLTDPISGKFAGSPLAETKEVAKLERSINKLAEDENEVAVLEFIEGIRKALSSVYVTARSEEQELTPEYLGNLEFLLQVASNIEDIKTVVSTESDDFAIDNTTRAELMELLEDVDIQVAKVKGFHEMANRELVTATLAKHSNIMEGFFRERYEIEAREKGLVKASEINDYIFKQMQDPVNVINIEQKENEYWNALLSKGYTDIRYFEWLLADPGMNKSQFVQVVKNIMDKADMDTRIETDRSVRDIVKWVESLTMDNSGSPEKVWDKFLEKGKYKDIDGNIVEFTSPSVIPEFDSEYSVIHRGFQHKIDYLDRLILKAIKEKNTKKEEEYRALKDEQIEARSKILTKKKKDKKAMEERVNKQFAKLTEKEQEALRYIHNKLETADDRLSTAQNKKLVRTVGGMKIYNLPRKRKSGIEAAYDAKTAGTRFISSLKDFMRPPKDEDELNVVTEADADDFQDFKTSNTDIMGDPLYDVPVYYRNQLEDPSLQSYDIPSLLAFNEETTIFYQNYKMIEADLFNITTALKNAGDKKKVHKTDAILSNNVIDKHKDRLPKILQSESNKVLSAVNASINNRLYQRSYNNVYSKGHYRLIKAGETLGKYTSMTLLAANFGSASMTTIQGSIYRFVEGIAAEDFDLKDVANGSKKAWLDMGNILADSQRQFPKSKTLLLIRRFGLETQYKALVNKFVQKNFITKSMDEGTIYAITTLAETIVTANLMYTLMGNIKTINDKGDFINSEGKKVDRDKAMSLDEAYEVVDGELVLNKHVKFTDKNLTEPFIDDFIGEGTIAATEISRYIRSKYADLYGQYNQDMKSMAEMNVLGKLAFSMRKWIPRGFHRRYRGITSVNKTFDEFKEEDNLHNRFYSQDQKKFQEGYYTTAVRWIVSVRQEMKTKELGFMMAARAINKKLTFHERANLRRTGAEMAIMLASLGSALLARVVAQGLDDDDRNSDKVYFAAYLAQRIYMESMTFVNPFEFMDTIKSPAAAVNSFERIGNLIEQLIGLSYDTDTESWSMDYDDVYDRGSKEGQSKSLIKLYKALPFYSKVSQFKGMLGYDSNESIKDSYEYMK